MTSPNASPIVNQVRQIAADIFAVGPADITAASSPQTIAAWDSTAHLNLILAIEEQFDVQLSPEEIEQMHSIGEVATILEKKLPAGK